MNFPVTSKKGSEALEKARKLADLAKAACHDYMHLEHGWKAGKKITVLSPWSNVKE